MCIKEKQKQVDNIEHNWQILCMWVVTKSLSYNFINENINLFFSGKNIRILVVC